LEKAPRGGSAWPTTIARGGAVGVVGALLSASPNLVARSLVGTGDGSFRAGGLISTSFDPNGVVFVADVDGSADLISQVDGQVLELSGTCLAH